MATDPNLIDADGTPAVPLGRRMLRRPSAVSTPAANGPIRHALLDFDGTLSLLRAGWQHVMVDYFDEVLSVAWDEPVARRAACEDFIAQLTGRQTIYQCIELAEQLERRGVTPAAPETYKAEYLRRLHEQIEHRRHRLAAGADRQHYLVPGTLDLLDGLRQADIVCHLASGTDVAYVREEVDLLGLTAYFTSPGEAPRIHGALAQYRNFSKAMVIEQILAGDVSGDALLGLGDGFVEIEETCRAGGIAVGVASDETWVDETAASDPTAEPVADRPFDPWKKQRLWNAGAHILTPDWTECCVLFDWLALTR